METKEIVKCENDSKKGGIRLGLRNRKKTIVIGLLIAAILFSFLVAPVIVEKLQIVKCTQEILDSKKDTVATVTIFGSAASIAVGAVPGDSTTPLANQIAEINAFLVVVLISIYALKVLLTISTTFTFKCLVPLVCLSLIGYILFNRAYLKKLASKLLVFALVVFLTVPISAQIMKVVDTSLKTQDKIDAISVNVEVNVEEISESENKSENWWKNTVGYVVDKTKEVADSVAKVPKEIQEKLGNKFSEMIDAVAALVITCFVVPLLVMVFLIWVLKTLTGKELSAKKIYEGIHSPVTKGFVKTSKIFADNDNETYSEEDE